MLTRLSRVALATTLGAGLLVGAGTAVPAQAKTVVACVKKSNGKVKVLTTKKKQKKKCKKGWKKFSWNQTGKTGPQGPAGQDGAQGASQVVKDGTGKVLGKFLGLLPEGASFVFVLIDGGAFIYSPDGRVLPLTSPTFKTNTCTGTAYVRSSSPTNTQFYVGAAGGQSRLVYRKTNPTYGPSVAYQFTTATEVINQTVYRWNDMGACVADGNHNGTIVALQQVAAPADVPGPLTID
ncbi:MAG: hypothetical protein R2720_04065 [Candidatus Nanopelagicales bacterium]